MSPHLHPSGNIGHPRYQCHASPLLPYHTCGRIHQLHQRSLANLFMGRSSKVSLPWFSTIPSKVLANLSHCGDLLRYPCLGSPPYNQRFLANLSHLGDHPRYPCLGSPPLPWQCMHCTQGFENCSHACLHHFFTFFLYLVFLFFLLLERYKIHRLKRFRYLWGFHAGLPLKVAPEAVFDTLRLFSGKKTLGFWVILVGVCPNIIPITPQYLRLWALG